MGAWCYNGVMIILYYKSCPNCKNAERNLVREVALQKDMEYDDRYILALPDIWGEEVEKIGAAVPFLYCPEDGSYLELDAESEGMKKKVQEFFDKW